MNTFDEMRGKPCVDFVDWIDHNERSSFFIRMQSSNRRISDLDVGECWSRLLVLAWRDNLVADVFETEANVEYWIRATTRTMFRYMNLEERKRRGHIEKLRRGTESLISEFEEEEWNTVLSNISDDRCQHVSDLGPSTEWFSQCMEVLTVKQRSVIEMLVLGGMSAWEAHPLYEGKAANPCRLYDIRTRGLKAIRQRIESGEIEVGPGCRVA